MYAIVHNGSAGVVRYRTRREALRAVHELLEEAFGDNYGEAEVAEYAVCAA